MIVRTLHEARETGRQVESNTWQSNRLALRDDNLGFSFHITRMYANTKTRMHYKNHIEAVYCLAGEGRLIDLADNTAHPIMPGTLYVLDKHDAHSVTAKSELVLVCVFAPALHGTEKHDADGSYPLLHRAEPATT